MEIKARNVDDATVAKLKMIARKKGISQEELIRNILDSYAVASEIVATEDKYVAAMESFRATVQILSDRQLAVEQTLQKLIEYFVIPALPDSEPQ